MLDSRWRAHRLMESHPWTVMAIIVLLAILLALGLVRLDQALDITPNPNQVWIYGGTAEAAISLLSAVASSAITVAGVVFSATFVTMQLASSQYTPRVVQALSRRWTLQVVLGFYLGNFVYSLIVLRSVRPVNASGAAEFVPVLSVSVCVAISIACVGVLIFYIAYGMRSLQPTFLIDSAARETVDLLRRSLAISNQQRSVPDLRLPDIDPREAWIFQLIASGFLQRIRIGKLRDIATEADLVVRIDGDIGSFLMQGEPVLTVAPGHRCTPDVQARIRACIIVGLERTPEQDVEFGFRRVADIMLKALSPAINDPTTATYCINRLGELTVMMASQPEEQRYLVDDADQVRVVWRAEPFARCVHTAFSQLRFYIVADVSLMRYTLEMLERTTRLVGPAHQAVLLAEARRLRESFLASLTEPADQEAVTTAGAWIDDVEAGR
jgi:uncharacterized membrane protein